jgi:hypothetical protein
VLRTHQVRSDLQRISVIRLSDAGVWTNTKEASPVTMLVPMLIPMFDLNSAGSMTLARSRSVQRAAPKSPEVSLAAPESSADASPEPSVQELPGKLDAVASEAPEESEALRAAELEPEPPAMSDPVDSEPATLPEANGQSSADAHRIELIIDSLTRHELIEPIPVTVESLGDTVFTATVHSLNLTGTGNTLGDALIIVKDQLEILYERLSKTSSLDDDEKKYLKYLQSHIKNVPSDSGRHSRRSLWR